jgi:hypothetical protein
MLSAAMYRTEREGRRRPSSALSFLPSYPADAKVGVVPTYDGVRCNDNERILPARERDRRVTQKSLSS